MQLLPTQEKRRQLSKFGEYKRHEACCVQEGWFTNLFHLALFVRGIISTFFLLLHFGLSEQLSTRISSFHSCVLRCLVFFLCKRFKYSSFNSVFLVLTKSNFVFVGLFGVLPPQLWPQIHDPKISLVDSSIFWVCSSIHHIKIHNK